MKWSWVAILAFLLALIAGWRTGLRVRKAGRL